VCARAHALLTRLLVGKCNWRLIEPAAHSNSVDEVISKEMARLAHSSRLPARLPADEVDRRSIPSQGGGDVDRWSAGNRLTKAGHLQSGPLLAQVPALDRYYDMTPPTWLHTLGSREGGGGGGGDGGGSGGGGSVSLQL
jgi:hypothetical protein